jgi:hypothetical protein
MVGYASLYPPYLLPLASLAVAKAKAPKAEALDSRNRLRASVASVGWVGNPPFFILMVG